MRRAAQEMIATALGRSTPRPRSWYGLFVFLVGVALSAVGCGPIGEADVSTADKPLFPGSEIGTSLSMDAAEGATEISIETVVVAPDGRVVATAGSGDLYEVDPASDQARLLWAATREHMAFEVASAEHASRLLVLLADPRQVLSTGLYEVTTAGLQREELGASPLLICLDNHARATSPLVHEVKVGGDAAATWLEPVAFKLDLDLDGRATEQLELQTELPFGVCPRWSGDRTVVATATVVPGDDHSAVTIVHSPDGLFTIGEPGCQVTPSGFGPDDETLALAVLCFGVRSPDSGLYLATVDAASGQIALDQLDLAVAGVVANSAWHPDGRWIAVSLRALAPNDLAPSSLSTSEGSLVIVDTAAGATTVLASVVDPQNVVWLQEAVG